jgi:hypothetical protein
MIFAKLELLTYPLVSVELATPRGRSLPFDFRSKSKRWTPNVSYTLSIAFPSFNPCSS